MTNYDFSLFLSDIDLLANLISQIFHNSANTRPLVYIFIGLRFSFKADAASTLKSCRFGLSLAVDVRFLKGYNKKICKTLSLFL